MCANILSSFSKTPKHKSFHYGPRYFNAEKDELDKRVKMAKLAGDTDDSDHIRRKISFSDKFRDSVFDRAFSARIRHQKMMSRIRFLVVLNILLIMVLVVFFKLI